MRELPRQQLRPEDMSTAEGRQAIQPTVIAAIDRQRQRKLSHADVQAAEQPVEGREHHVREELETRFDVHGLTVDPDADRVGMPAELLLSLEEGHRVASVAQ